jgi:hypothetical protein
MLIRQLDVKTAFLNSAIDEDIYMEQPEGFEDKNNQNLVCKLQKSLYGLKQAPRMWNIMISGILKGLEFIQTHQDPCLYIKKKGNIEYILAIWVDDIILASTEESGIVQITNDLRNQFDITDLGKLDFFLGIKFSFGNQGLHLSQEKYIKELLKKFQMDECKAVDTPTSSGITLSKDMAPKTEEEIMDMKQIPYREAVGSIMYLISFSVSSVSKYLNNPGKQHWLAVKRILRYLKGTMDLGITIKNTGSKNITITAYADSDYATDKDNVKKISTVHVCLADNREIPGKYEGSLSIKRKGISVTLNNVLYIPDLKKNLISISKITRNGWYVVFNGNECNILNKDKENLLQGKPSDTGLYRLTDMVSIPRQPVCLFTTETSKDINMVQTTRTYISLQNKEVERKIHTV